MNIMKIVGFDPGYGILGWGVIEPVVGGLAPTGGALYGVIRTPSTAPAHERLLTIRREVELLLEEYRPGVVVVEHLYMNKNVKTAGEVYQARGVLLASIADFGCELIELNPNKIKQMITGRGQASKTEVQIMVQRLLNIEKKITPDDAADALAGAIAGSFLVQSRVITDRAKIR